MDCKIPGLDLFIEVRKFTSAWFRLQENVRDTFTPTSNEN